MTDTDIEDWRYRIFANRVPILDMFCEKGGSHHWVIIRKKSGIQIVICEHCRMCPEIDFNRFIATVKPGLTPKENEKWFKEYQRLEAIHHLAWEASGVHLTEKDFYARKASWHRGYYKLDDEWVFQF